MWEQEGERPASARAKTKQKQPLKRLLVVPLAGLEPACLAAFDFESNASTNFATGAAKRRC